MRYGPRKASIEKILIGEHMPVRTRVTIDVFESSWRGCIYN
jgi:hypothetical protein